MKLISKWKKNPKEKESNDFCGPEQSIVDYLTEKSPQEYKRNDQFEIIVKEDIDFQYFVELHIHLDTEDLETIKKESRYVADLFMFPPYPIVLFRFVYYRNGKEVCFVTKTDAGEYYITVGEESTRFK